MTVEGFRSDMADNPPLIPGVETCPGDAGIGKGWEDEAIDDVSESFPEVALDGIWDEDRYMGGF